MCHRGTCIRPLSGASGTPAKFAGYPACDMPGRQGRLPSLPGASAGVPASLSAFAVAFAQAARGLSAFAVAFAQAARGLSAFAVAFAQAAQVSRHLPWRLRRRRKSLGICRGVCASGASLSVFTRHLSRPGFLTALPRAGRWGVCWASSRRPTRGERRRRRGLHSARSAGC